MIYVQYIFKSGHNYLTRLTAKKKSLFGKMLNKN